MKSRGTFRLVDTSIGISAIIFTMLCVCSSLWAEAEQSNALVFAWAVLSTLISYFLLDGLDFFEGFRPFPSRSNIFTLLFILPWGPLASRIVFSILLDHSIVRYRAIFLAVPLAAILSVVYQHLCGWFFVRQGKTRKILMVMNAEDRENLIQELSDLGLAKYFEWAGSISDRPELIIISRASVRDFVKHPDLLFAHLDGIPILDIRSLQTDLHGRISMKTTDLWLYLQKASKQSGVQKVYFEMKSLVEPILALALFFILSPLFLVVAIAVRCTSSGPILFRQLRTGYRGKNFELYKFRSMNVAAERDSVAWATCSSEVERLTPIGSFLRRSHLDELPQLWNIIRGELSFVGPRPERPEIYASLYKDIPGFNLRTLVRPGITGWAQIMAGYAGSVEESKNKLEYDLYYMQHMAPRLDLAVLIKTLLMLCRFWDPKAR